MDKDSLPVKRKYKRRKRDQVKIQQKRIATLKTLARPQDLLVAQKKLEGKTATAIGRELDMNPGTVKAILKREDVQKILNDACTAIAAEIPKTVKRHIRLANMLEKDYLNKEYLTVAYDANKTMLQSTGVLASAAQSIVHQTFIQQQTNNIIPPVIAQLLQKHYGNTIDVKEIEYEKEEKEERL